MYRYLYERLKELREKRNVKQSEIANLLKITRQQYWLYESGRREIPIHHMKILALFYNTTVDYIVGLTNDVERKNDYFK